MIIGPQKYYIPDDIWEFIMTHPGVPLRAAEIGEAINRNPSIIHRHLVKLVEIGEIKRKTVVCKGPKGQHYMYEYRYNGASNDEEAINYNPSHRHLIKLAEIGEIEKNTSHDTDALIMELMRTNKKIAWTIDRICNEIGVSRSNVIKHLHYLEREGLLKTYSLRSYYPNGRKETKSVWVLGAEEYGYR